MVGELGGSQKVLLQKRQRLHTEVSPRLTESNSPHFTGVEKQAQEGERTHPESPSLWWQSQSRSPGGSAPKVHVPNYSKPGTLGVSVRCTRNPTLHNHADIMDVPPPMTQCTETHFVSDVRPCKYPN